MKDKILKTILIILLVTTLIAANLMVLATNIISYAANGSNNGNIEFISYFETEDGNKTNDVEKAINDDDIKLCMEIEIQEEGYLNGQIELKNSNFKFKQEEIQNVEQISDQVITLKQINAGEKVKIQIGLEVNLGKKIEVGSFNKESTVLLKGTYKNVKQKESDIEIESKIKIELTSPYEENEEGINLNTQILTNKIYDVNGENKRIVQVLVNNGLKDEGYPIKETNIELEAPEGMEKVEVLDRGTIATNGKEETENNSDSFKYVQNGNKLNIDILNNEENGEISYGKQKEDSIIVTYVYSEDKEITNQEIKVRSKIQLYDEQATILEKEVTNKIEEEKDEIIGYEILSEQDIYKGKMYAKESQEYKSVSQIDIRYPQIEKNIQISEGNAIFHTQIEETLYTAEANVVYKRTILDKEQLERVIGDKGELVIKKLDGTEIRKINKEDFAVEGNEPIIIDYEDNQEEIIVEINNAQNSGTIQLKNVKEIKQESMEREDFKKFTNLTLVGKLSATNNIKERKVQSTINLKETETKAELEVSTKDLLVGETNKNVEIKTTLLTNSNQYDLFKNPIIELEFPKEIKEVRVNKVSLLYGEELAKQTEQIYENDQGKKVVKIELLGEQTKYTQTDLVKGANIIVNCDLIVDYIEEAKSDNIILRYTNDEDVQYNNNGICEAGINYVVTEKARARNMQILDEQAKNVPEEEQIESQDPIILTKSITAGNGNDIYERQVQKYTIKVKNNTKNDILNINVEDQIPNQLTFVEANHNGGFKNGYIEKEDQTTYSEKIELLKAGEEVEVYYFIRVKQSTDIQGNKVGTKAKATIEGNSNVYESNLVENTIKESKFQIDMVSADNVNFSYAAGNHMKYKIEIKNITSDNLTDVEAKMILPEGTSFVDAADMLYDEVYEHYYMNDTEDIKKANYDSTNGVITWNIGNLNADEEVAVYVIVNLEKMTGNDEYRTIPTKVTIKAGNTIEYPSNTEEILEINDPTANIKLETNLKDNYVYEGEKFEYIITVTNTSKVDLSNVSLIDELPEGIIGEEVHYIEDGGEAYSSVEKSVSIGISLAPGESTQIKISVMADEIKEDLEEIEVKNKVILDLLKIDDIESNELITVIKKKKDNNPDNPGNNPDNNPDDNPENNQEGDQDKPSNDKDPENNSKQYNISGSAWIDSNRNGSKDVEENTLSGIEVDLYNKNGEKAKDSNGDIITAKTGKDGIYKLSNIKKGNYLIVFNYDNYNYSLTEYKKSGVGEELNSNVTETELNGKIVAITDTIKITNKDIENINMGCIKNGIFDLRLDKYISGITVQNNKESRRYSYNDVNFAKIELNRKILNSTSVTIEYKISVTNEGETPGYARKIVDYMPVDLEFDADMNEGWDIQDGMLISTELSDEIINPGETKTIDLILTKQMTEDNTGTVINTAEIFECDNERLIDDIDSIEKNKKSGEDDMSTVSLIIGINTGRIVMYIALTITSIAILGVGIYLINKKVLKL